MVTLRLVSSRIAGLRRALSAYGLGGDYGQELI
jgi:hypothetical protein